ncbi:hypothetical protein [Kribbella kalugense]|uniref:hypothetical protein n=1 Tax=Kribbella kalugense TaxID=2512221 RepID=UPI0010659968|nr:hypothetical protein [Kribbella kalugense]
MSDDRQTFTLRLELDSSGQPLLSDTESPAVLVDEPDLTISLIEDEESGYGFGLGEVVTIVIAVSTGVASDIIADAIKSSVKAIVRRVRGTNEDGSGTDADVARVVESERSISSSEPPSVSEQ